MRGHILAACVLAVAVTALATFWFFREGTGSAASPSPTAPALEGQPRRWGDPPQPPGPVDPGRPTDRTVYSRTTPDKPEAASRFAPDELLVRFRHGASPAQRFSALAGLGGFELDRSAQTGASLIRLPPGSDVAAEARKFDGHPLVDSAQPNYTYTTSIEPDDPAYTEIQHWYYHAINAPAGWDVETGSSSVKVAVLDTGVDVTHPDLAPQIWINPGEIPDNGIDDDGNGCVDDVHGCNTYGSAYNGNIEDDYGHGTFVGGVICGEANNGVSGAGTAFDCTIMAVKVLQFGDGNSESIADGIVYAAENGADVINMSLGIGCSVNEPFSDPLVAAALDTAHDTYGVTIVVSAGNSDQGCVSFPASDPNAIAVSASEAFGAPDQKAFFSQWGPEIAVTAPGVDIVSAVPPALCGNMGQCLDGRTAMASGTSFSAPQVSGLAALLLAQNPARTNEDVRTIMMDTAYDLPDGDTPNWDGAGRIDVGKALGGDSAFAKVSVSHFFPPVLQLHVGVGNPAAPLCEDTIVDQLPQFSFGITGSFGVGECASFWPPTAGQPWYLKAVDDDPFVDNGQISRFSLLSAGQLCTDFDTPVAIPDSAAAGGVSSIDCPPVAELTVALSAPAVALTGEQMDYDLSVENRGSITTPLPVIAEVVLPPQVSLAGPAPAGCSPAGSTVTCGFGTLASNESATLALTVDVNAAGDVQACAEVDPGNAIAEPVEDNNTDCADTEVVQVPPPSFVNPDPIGDAVSSPFAPVVHDITEVRGALDATTFYLTVQFDGPVDPADANTGQEVGGYIDFDVDQDANTGFFAIVDFICPDPPGLPGVETTGYLFGVNDGRLPFFGGFFGEGVRPAGFPSETSAPIFFGEDSFTAFIPLEIIGGDDSFDFAMALGSFYDFSDCAPDGVFISCDDGVCTKPPPPPPAANDDFDSPVEILEPLSPPQTVEVSTRNATMEPDEPQPPCAGVGKTVWFTFTPPQNAVLVASTGGSNFNTAIAAYTGTKLNDLHNVGCAAEEFFGEFGHIPSAAGVQLSLLADGGTTYYFQVGGLFGVGGNLSFSLGGADVASCSQIANLGFEEGLTNSSALPCWTVITQDGSFGSWCNQRGIFAPVGDCTGGFTGVLAPPAGFQAAMSNSTGAGSHVLYRCGVLDEPLISFQLYVNNHVDDFVSPLSLDYRRFPNQQFRADLVSLAGLTANEFTLNAAHILMNLYQTGPGDEIVSGYDPVSANAAAFVGQNVCLRFAEVNNLHGMQVGVDTVRFLTEKSAAGDSDGDTIPNSSDANDDNDGCTDLQETNPGPLQGAPRDPHNYWDFFDTPSDVNVRDRAIAIGDVGRLVARFGAVGDPSIRQSSPPLLPPEYHPAFDRTPSIGLGGGRPNGSITVQDLALLVLQFGDTCA